MEQTHLSIKYMKNFYNNFTENRYCQVIIEPKLATLKEKFSNKLKS